MKKYFSLILFFAFVTTLQAQKMKYIPQDLVVYDLEGNPKTLGELMKNDGVPVIIDFWATWCKPCLNALKNTNEKYPQWKKEDGAKIVLISIDKEDKINKIKALAEKKGWQYELYIDRNKATQKALGVVQIPNTFLVNEEGEILRHEEGYLDGDEDILIKKVRKYSK